MLNRLFVGALIALGAGGMAWADSIKVDGVPYQGVVVSESQTTYYVQIPADGRTISVQKSDVNPADVVKDSDKAARAALIEEWRKNSALHKKSEAVPPGAPGLPPIGVGPVPKPDLSAAPSLAAKPGVPATPPKAPAPGPVAASPNVPAPGPTAAPVAGPPPVEAPYVSPKRPGVVDKEVTTDPNGVKRVVLRGDQRKEEGYENRAEQQKQEDLQRAEQQADEAARAEAQMAAQPYGTPTPPPAREITANTGQAAPPQVQPPTPVPPPPDEAAMPSNSAVINSEAISSGSAIEGDE